jgi:hypothetical protein
LSREAGAGAKPLETLKRGERILRSMLTQLPRRKVSDLLRTCNQIEFMMGSIRLLGM